jgi:hypothetical protein
MPVGKFSLPFAALANAATAGPGELRIPGTDSFADDGCEIACPGLNRQDSGCIDE